MEENTNKVIVFLDTVGRTVVAELVQETEALLKVKNPGVVHLQVKPGANQLELQIMPLFFREFIKPGSTTPIWTYQKSLIASCEDLVLDDRFLSQYKQLAASAVEAPQPAKETEVIRLFDDEKK